MPGNLADLSIVSPNNIVEGPRVTRYSFSPATSGYKIFDGSAKGPYDLI